MSMRAPASGALDGAVDWQRVSAGTALPVGEVHVWRADLDRMDWPFLRLARSLSPDERERADAYRFAQDRRRFMVARGLLRWLLARYLGDAPDEVCLCYGPRGKPELSRRRGGHPLRFNCSRSRGQALFALTRGRRIGVDLETVRPIPEARQIAERWFTPAERAALATVWSNRHDEAFMRLWTLKEAFVKALGDGIADGLERMEVAMSPGCVPVLCALDGDSTAAAHWSLRVLPSTAGECASLVLEGRDYRLRCLTLDASIGV